ncbi:MAG TPA: glycosyltransferase family 4 protein [Sedimentisphaerales bacterium]|nr:glycosyltransferase family 4 protein [Sedimentisphaerales bacterium]
MHILYIHQHFATPAGSTGTRSYEFARRWVKAGHKVTLIAGHYDIGGLQVDRALYQKQTIEGINVVVVGTKYSNKQSHLRRITSFLSFCFLSIYAGLRTKGVDVIYVSSTPLTVGIPAMVIKWARHIPFVFEVRDQWPEIPIELGITTNRFLIKILLWLEKTIYKNCSSIVALSPGQADGIRAVLTEEKSITVIPNSCDIDLFRPDIDGSAVRQRMGWGDKLVLLHTGAMGKVNGLDFVINAAERLKEHSDIMFVLIGDGNQKLFLEGRVKELGLTNVEILSSVPKQELPEFYAAADMGLVIIGNFPIIEHNSANKFFDSLSAGKPVLLNYSGWQRKILEENAAGFGCDLCNLDQFVEKVLHLNSHRKQIEQMGQNARQVAIKEFNRDELAKQALAAISSIAK